MRLLLALLLLMPLAAFGEPFNCNAPAVAFTCTPAAAPPSTCTPPQPATVTSSCPAGQTGSVTTSYSCVGTTWTPTTVSSCTTPPPTCGAAVQPFTPVQQGAGQTHRFSGALGVSYASKIPALHGNISGSYTPYGGAGMTVQWSISKCAGDFTNDPTWRCEGIFGIESNGLGWAQVPVTPVPRCLAGPDWFVNFRFVTCPTGVCEADINWNAN